ncbi:MAG: hypothetical protein GTO45_24770 [Candidatus Aminicenantes bacterium]|nr:hypothetical protein [Candidatus Aminicenantes bacterium]NIM81958.1 hypothetical protein [Candidatus Aminicenantes bacterium]NIN21346.1 hypothetical protein [Candidatus Aminicenantes bacterium]NIN45167.1 hypothetical protein [Candidatus Aminicenantes bacterium]NIN87984.1 hypothetical protein [Candidatus Aminicenantes bacterium]
MAFSNQELEDYLLETRVTFENVSTHTSFKATILDFGYDENRILEGVNKRVEAQRLFRLYIEKRQQKLGLKKKLDALFKAVYGEYSGHIQRLRKELILDEEATEILVLNGPRDRTRSGFIEMSTNFYTTAIKDIDMFNKIQRFGFTVEKLQSGLDGVEAFAVMNSQYEKLKGECQRLVVERDEAFKDLRRWMAAFIATCRVAYKDNLQTLEEVGIFVLNRPRKKEKVDENENQTNDAEAQTQTEEGQ